MEDTLNDQSSVSGKNGGGSGKLLRYPLRSASKSKDENKKPPVSVPATASASRRVRPSANVSQSISVLDLSSSKEKSAKPHRRLSIPTKPTARPTPQSAKSITPISEARANRSRNIEGKSDNPASDVSRALNRRKFSVMSSASYWLSHIKLSEAAGKHQLSLGFFKLAQEAACENLQLLRDELKSYALRHNVIELGESAQEVLQSYEVSEIIIQVTRSSSEDAQSSSSVNGIHKPKPKMLRNNIGSVARGSVNENYQKKLVSNIKSSTDKKTANLHSSSEAGSCKIQKNFQKLVKKEFNKEKQMVKSKGKKSAIEDTISCPEEAVTEENKENMDASPVEEISLET